MNIAYVAFTQRDTKPFQKILQTKIKRPHNKVAYVL